MTRHIDTYADGLHVSARRRQKAEILGEALAALYPDGTELQLVDFGCADGAVPVLLLGSPLGERIARITGITRLDYNDLTEKPAHAHPRFTRLIGDLQEPLEDLPLPWGQCDAVLATAFFHYLEHPEIAFAHAARLLKPGGYLLAGMPAPWVLRMRQRGAFGLPCNNYIRTVCPLGTWREVATGCGLTEVSRRPIQWLAISPTASLERWLRRTRMPLPATNYLVTYQRQ